jgi:ribosome-associated protein
MLHPQIAANPVPLSEIEIRSVRSQGPGGQNVNKVSTAVHLRFDIGASSLPDFLKQQLRSLRDRRITGDGVIVIKAQQYRSQEMNRQDALARLSELVRSAGIVRPKRKPTRPSRMSRRQRLEAKQRRSITKRLRAGVGRGTEESY